MSRRHRIYLVPGLFGFSDLAGYDYFVHVRAALERRYADAGVEAEVRVVATPPTSSIRHRARLLVERVHSSAGSDDGPIHLVGHSTGGLDARLVLSPLTNLRVPDEHMSWTRRVRTAVSLNAPHYGTPLATYFATVSGTRVLYALSLLTVMSLSLGEPSLAVFSKLLAGVGGIDDLVGSDFRLVRRTTHHLLRFLDDERRSIIQLYLEEMRHDQGAIIQITPESMDLFNTTTENSPSVRYGCVAAAAPPPRAIRVATRFVRSPYAGLTAAMFSTLHTLTSQRHARYGYARPDPEVRRGLLQSHGREVNDRSNDGIVPTLSMIWGELLWSGPADHLDVIGHFDDGANSAPHVDWVTSGAGFTRAHFSRMMNRIVRFQLRDGS